MSATATTATEYPLFSDAEMTRRREALWALVEEHDLACLVVHGLRGSTAVPWVTGWLPTHMAAAVVVPGERVLLLVQRFNHVANAIRMAASGVDVVFAGHDATDAILQAIRRRGRQRRTVGWIGPLSHDMATAMEASGRSPLPLDAAYVDLRLVKSAEELEWMRRGAELTDRSLDALLAAARPGTNEWQLAAAVEQAYVGLGGVNHLHYVATTSMEAPERYVPAQWPSARELQSGDVVVTELSASWWGYPGQVLRSIAVGTPPGPLHRELHDVADAALDAVLARIRPGVHAQELVDAADVIADAGHTLGDDLLHGFGGGYLPPVLRTNESPVGPVPDLRLREGMTVVVQPNVATRDLRAGVQTGELVEVTSTGHRRMHAAPRGFLEVA